MHQIVCRLGLPPSPHWGSLQRSPSPLAGLGDGVPDEGKERGEEKGRGKEGKGRGEKGRGGNERGTWGTLQIFRQIDAFEIVA